MDKDTVYKWLANIYDTDVNKVNNALNNEKASLFLIVWSSFEQMCFDKFMKEEDIEKFSKNNMLIIKNMFLNEAFEYFYFRYQNSENYRKLKHSKRKSFVDLIRSKDINELSEDDKLSFLIYVIYRYRNNIFHGNKAVLSWNNYDKQITYCINSMMEIIKLVLSSKEEDNL